MTRARYHSREATSFSTYLRIIPMWLSNTSYVVSSTVQSLRGAMNKSINRVLMKDRGGNSGGKEMSVPLAEKAVTGIQVAAGSGAFVVTFSGIDVAIKIIGAIVAIMALLLAQYWHWRRDVRERQEHRIEMEKHRAEMLKHMTESHKHREEIKRLKGSVDVV